MPNNPPNNPRVDFPFPSVIVDTILNERSSSFSGTYDPLEPGQPFNPLNHSVEQLAKYGSTILLGQSADQDNEFQERFWATPPHTQDIYNYSITDSADATDYPIFTRKYLELRDQYPVLKRTPLTPFTGLFAVTVNNAGSGYDPANPPAVTCNGGATAIAIVNPTDGSIAKITLKTEGVNCTSTVTIAAPPAGGVQATATGVLQDSDCLLVKEDAQPAEGKWSSLYLLVTRVYETLPGPILSSYQLLPNERGLKIVTQKQYVAHGTVTAGVTGAGVTHLTIVNGGSGFTAGTYNGGSSGGGGTGFTWTYTVASFTAGALADAALTNGGGGYTTPPTVTVSGGGGSGGSVAAILTGTTLSKITLLTTDNLFQATPTTTITDNGTGVGASANAVLKATGIDSVGVVSGGINYTAPTITFSAPDIAGGTQATGTVNLSGTSIVSITIDNPGSNYTKTPTFVLTDATGSGAVLGAPLLVATPVDHVDLITTGNGYQNPNTVTISDGMGTATAQAFLTPTTVQSLSILIVGSGYSSPTLAFSGGGGSGAAGTIGVATGTITSVTLTAAGANFTSPPTLTTPSGGGSGATILASIGFLTYVDVDEVTATKDLVQRTTIDLASIPAQIKYPISMRIDHQDQIVDSLIVLSTTTGGTAVGLLENGTIGGSGPALVYDYVDYMTDSQLAAYAATVRTQFSVTGRKIVGTLVYQTIQPSGSPQIWTFRTNFRNLGTTVGIMDLTYEVKPFGINKVHTIKFEG